MCGKDIDGAGTSARDEIVDFIADQLGTDPEELVVLFDGTEEEAREYIERNIIGLYAGPGTPAIMYPKTTTHADSAHATFVRTLLGTPPFTRLVLVSDDILEQLGTRNEQGYRMTAEWGEQRPEGWYEPVITVHHDQPLPLDVDRLSAALRVCGWTPAVCDEEAAAIAREYAEEMKP